LLLHAGTARHALKVRKSRRSARTVSPSIANIVYAFLWRDGRRDDVDIIDYHYPTGFTSPCRAEMQASDS
jgi:hypothetical protein